MGNQFAMDVAKKVFLSAATAAAGYKTKQLLAQWDMARARGAGGPAQSGTRVTPKCVGGTSYNAKVTKNPVNPRGKKPRRNQPKNKKGTQKKT